MVYNVCETTVQGQRLSPYDVAMTKRHDKCAELLRPDGLTTDVNKPADTSSPAEQQKNETDQTQGHGDQGPESDTDHNEGHGDQGPESETDQRDGQKDEAPDTERHQTEEQKNQEPDKKTGEANEEDDSQQAKKEEDEEKPSTEEQSPIKDENNEVDQTTPGNNKNSISFLEINDYTLFNTESQIESFRLKSNYQLGLISVN